jgi:pyridoxamine 5'-phosphate oxidase
MSNLLDLRAVRTDYVQPELNEESLNEDPILQFENWFAVATEQNVASVNAMTLATVSPEGMPSMRVVLLKEVLDGKFVFFSNYKSQKGSDVAKNSKVCLNFFWEPLMRQVRISGRIQLISRQESEEYFHSRPYGSQISAFVSNQSQGAPSREKMEELARRAREAFPEDVPCPEYWGGYAVVPTEIEFWQGRPDRLHDRFVYKAIEGKWKIKRLWA